MILRGKIFQNTAWLVAERVFRLGTTAVVLSFVARALGPAEFGVLNYALLLFGLALPLATLCFDGIVIAELVRTPAETPVILGSAFALRLMMGMLIAGALALIHAIQGVGLNSPEIGGIAAMLMLQAAEVPELWFQQNLVARRITLARLGALVAGAGVKLKLAFSGAGASALVWAQAGENTVYVILLFWGYAAAGNQVAAWRWEPGHMRRLFRLAWPLALAGGLVGVYLRLDQLVVQHWLPSVAAGIYFAATRLTDAASLAIAAVGASLFPALATAHNSTDEEFQSRLRSVFDLLTGLGWLVALGFTVTAPWLVVLMFGREYAAAVPVVIIKAWTCLLLFSGVARGQFVVLTGATRANLAAACIGIAAQGLAAWWLVPRYGGIGAATASAGAAILSGWLTSFLFSPLRPCAMAQTQGFLIPFLPKQWRSCVRLLS